MDSFGAPGSVGGIVRGLWGLRRLPSPFARPVGHKRPHAVVCERAERLLRLREGL